MSRSSNDRQPSRARRVSGWTSNFLATGIVLVAAVGVGRQLVTWWRVDPAEAPAVTVPANPGLISEAGEQPFQLTFGDGYSLRRMELTGDVAAATQRLQAECRTILENAADPPEPPTQAEQRFLERTSNRRPLEDLAGRWQIHQFDGKLPLLVAVKMGRPAERQQVGLTLGRVVAWGLAMPTDEEVCTLLLYEARGAASVSSPQADIPLPTSLRRTLRLRGAEGSTTIGLAGASSPRRASLELDRALAADWTATGWRQAGSAWHNRYQASGKDRGRIDVQLADDGRGGVVGLLIVHGEQLP